MNLSFVVINSTFKLLLLIALLSLSAQPSLAQSDDSIFYDPRTGLTWQQRGDDVLRSWEEAELFCRDLIFASKSDWRLPSVKELDSIVDRWRNSGAFNPNFFPQTRSDYWSFTPSADNANDAWAVNFGIGLVYTALSSRKLHARCVR